VIIRGTDERDWPRIYPFFRSIVAAGETYAYPDNLSMNDARSWWMEDAPGHTVVAVDGETVTEAFDHPEHGLVGLHVMYQRR